MRYIGGKSLMIDNINNVIEQNNVNVDSVIDLFSGSGVVAAYFKSRGYQTISNDFMYFSYVLQKAAIGLNFRPEFSKLGINDLSNGLIGFCLSNFIFSFLCWLS